MENHDLFHSPISTFYRLNKVSFPSLGFDLVKNENSCFLDISILYVYVIALKWMVGLFHISEKLLVAPFSFF